MFDRMRTERAFERVRVRYEGLVRKKGYWFDNRDYLGHYSDAESSATLRECYDTLEKLRRKVEGYGTRWNRANPSQRYLEFLAPSTPLSAFSLLARRCHFRLYNFDWLRAQLLCFQHENFWLGLSQLLANFGK